MNNPLKDITRSLAKKLILTVGLIILVGGSISWYMLISSNRKNLMGNAVEYTASYSDLVKKSIRSNMLVFSSEPIQQTIESIGSAGNIERIRIFDAKGRIFHSSNKPEIGRLVNRNAFACTGCHSDPDNPSETLKDNRKWITYQGRKGYRILTYVEPIYNEPSCVTDKCHAHSGQQRVLGILETDFSLAALDKDIRGQTVDMTLYAIGFMATTALILYIVLRRFVLKPVATISGSMEGIAAGKLGREIAFLSEDEMGRLAGTFNAMTKDLKAAKEKVDNWTQTLEEEIEKKSDELKKSQDRLIQAEKLAALGRLTSDVAHRIRNPLTAVGGFAHRLEKIATGEKEKTYAGVMVTEVKRLEQILRDVLTFSREAKLCIERHPAEEIVNDVLALYKELCAEQSVQMEISIEENLPHVLMDINQAKQALDNLIMNALDVMPHGGTLSIRAEKEYLNSITYIALRITDTGTGVPEDKLPFIFEPFFSTKDIQGTGLGLSITRKIMEEHGGFVKAESTEGKGSTFSLYFPYQSEEESRGVQCWEYMKCGRDKDAAVKCPAYPHFGRTCWAVAGTFCEGKAQGTFAQKYEDCKKCEFFQKMKKIT